MELFKLETISVYGFCLYRVQMLCYDPGIPSEVSWDCDVPLLGFMLFLVAHLEKTAPHIYRCDYICAQHSTNKI